MNERNQIEKIDFGNGEIPERMTDPESGRDYWKYRSGTTKWCDDGKWRTGPDMSPIMLDPIGMNARRKALSLLSNIKGRMDGVRKYFKDIGLEVQIPDPDDLSEEDLIKADGDVERLLRSVFTAAWLRAAGNSDAKNFRGVTEGFGKAINLGDAREREPEPPPYSLERVIVQNMADLIKNSMPRIVEGEELE